jgi:O-antigen/teichoic acid export membrane protein
MKRTSVWHWVRIAPGLAGLRLESGALTKARLSRLGWEGFWVVFGQAVAVVGAVVGVRVLTELLPPEVYGELALAMTGATLLNQVVFGPISNGASRFYAVAQEAGDIPTYLLAVKRLALVVTGWVMTAAAPVAALLLLTGHDRWLGLLAAVLGFALLSGYNGILDAIQNAARQRLVVAWHQGLASWGRFLVAAGMIVLLGASSTAAMVGYAIGAMVVLASQSWFLTRSVHVFRGQLLWEGSTPASWLSQMVAYGWPFAAGSVFNWVYYASRSWALALFSTTTAVGQFQALTQVAYTPVSMAGQTLLSFLTPMLYARAGDCSDRMRVRKTLRLVTWAATAVVGLTIAAAVASFFLHKAVFQVMVAAEYRSASRYMPYMVMSAGILQASIILSSILMVAKRPRALLASNTVGNGSIAVLNRFSTKWWGIDGLIGAALVGSFLHLAWTLLIVFRYLRRQDL